MSAFRHLSRSGAELPVLLGLLAFKLIGGALLLHDALGV